MDRNPILFRSLVVGVILLLLCISITPSVALDNVKKSSYPISNGKTLYVGGSGPGNYTKIQDAIDDAYDGDTVFVYDDSSPYYESFDESQVVYIDKSINLIGENRETTIIDGKKTHRNGIKVQADWVTISGFTIKNNTRYGIYVWHSNKCSINNNILYSNENGIFLFSSINSRIKYELVDYNNIYGANLVNVVNCLVKKNSFTNNKVGLMIYCVFYFTLLNRVISNNFLDNEKQADFVVSHYWFVFPIMYMFNFWNDIYYLHLVYVIEGKFLWYYDYYSGSKFVYYTFVDCFPRRQPYDF